MLKVSQYYTKHDGSTVWKQRQSYKGQYSEIHYVTSRNKKKPSQLRYMKRQSNHTENRKHYPKKVTHILKYIPQSLSELSILTSYYNKNTSYFTNYTDLQKCSKFKSTVKVLFLIFALLVFPCSILAEVFFKVWILVQRVRHRCGPTLFRLRSKETNILIFL